MTSVVEVEGGGEVKKSAQKERRERRQNERLLHSRFGVLMMHIILYLSSFSHRGCSSIFCPSEYICLSLSLLFLSGIKISLLSSQSLTGLLVYWPMSNFTLA